MILKLFDPRPPKRPVESVGEDWSEASVMLYHALQQNRELGYGLRLMRLIWLVTALVAVVGWTL